MKTYIPQKAKRNRCPGCGRTRLLNPTYRICQACQDLVSKYKSYGCDWILYHPYPGTKEPVKQKCILVRCKWHLLWEMPGWTTKNATQNKSIDDAVRMLDSMEATCTFEVASRGGETLEAIAQMLQITKERVRQIEGTGIIKKRNHGAIHRLQLPSRAKYLEPFLESHNDNFMKMRTWL